MSLGNYVDIKPGSIATMENYDASIDECCNKCGENCTIGLTGVTTFMFSPKTQVAGYDSLEGDVIDTTDGIYIKATVITGRSDFQEDIEFDLGNGTAITLPARVFQATVIYPVQPVIATTTYPTFRVYQSIGKGNAIRGNASHVRRSFTIYAEAGQYSDTYPIPKFADAASFSADDEDLLNIRLEQTKNTTGGANLDSALMGRTEAESTPYAFGAKGFRIYNPTDDEIFVTVSWRLAFG